MSTPLEVPGRSRITGLLNYVHKCTFGFLDRYNCTLYGTTSRLEYLVHSQVWLYLDGLPVGRVVISYVRLWRTVTTDGHLVQLLIHSGPPELHKDPHIVACGCLQVVFSDLPIITFDPKHTRSAFRLIAGDGLTVIGTVLDLETNELENLWKNCSGT